MDVCKALFHQAIHVSPQTACGSLISQVLQLSVGLQVELNQRLAS